MGRQTVKHIDTFKAIDAEGAEHDILVFQTFHEIATRGGGTREGAGLMSLKTRDGQSVNRIDKGKYEIVGLRGHTLTSDDPNAI